MWVKSLEAAEGKAWCQGELRDYSSEKRACPRPCQGFPG